MLTRLALLSHRVARATHGDYTGLIFCHTRLVHRVHGTNTRPRNKHKNEEWQDRLPPVLGAMCSTLLPDEHGRDLSNLALANKRPRVDRDPIAYSGNVIDPINEDMADCIRGYAGNLREVWETARKRRKQFSTICETSLS
jgi:hypothetical protein